MMRGDSAARCAQALWQDIVCAHLTSPTPDGPRAPGAWHVAVLTGARTSRAIVRRAIGAARQIAPAERVVVVVDAGHKWREVVRGASASAGFLEQPACCGTAPAAVLALTHILSRDPTARVMLMPAPAAAVVARRGPYAGRGYDVLQAVARAHPELARLFSLYAAAPPADRPAVLRTLYARLPPVALAGAPVARAEADRRAV